MTNPRTSARNAARIMIGLGALLGAPACGDFDADDQATEVTSPIVNGTPAGGAGVVRLFITDGGAKATRCTGTVISSNRILTAGHCVDQWLTIRDSDGDATFILQGDLLANAEYTLDGTNWICLNDSTRTTCNTTFPMHVSRMGNGETSPDIGIIRFTSALQGIKSSNFRGLSTGNVAVGRTVEEWGQGFINTAGTAGSSRSRVMMRSVVRTTEVKATTIKTSDSASQICSGDSGGPIFVGASDLIVGVLSRFGNARVGVCDAVNTQPGWARITPAVITFINNNRRGADPLCRESIAGTGFQDCD